MIVLRLLGINISVSIIFSYHAIIETLVLISVAYLLVIIQSYIFIRKRSISELASDLTKKEVNETKITFSEITLGLLGIIMIVGGYFYLLN